MPNVKRDEMSNGTRTEVVLDETRRLLQNWIEKVWAKELSGIF